jgi:glutaredoxin
MGTDMRRFKWVLLVSILALFCQGAGTLEPNESTFGTVRMVLFYSGESEVSMGIIEGTLPTLKDVYPIDVRLYDVDVSQNYALLLALEERYGQKERELPIIFVGDEVISGEEEISERLESTIAQYEASGGSEFPDVPQFPGGGIRTLSHPVYMAYFYQRGCVQCDRVESMINHFKVRYEGLVVREIDIDTSEGKRLNESMSERMGVPEAERLTAPSVFFSRDALVGKEVTTTALKGLIETYDTEKLMDPPWQVAEEEKDQAGLRIMERFRTLGLSAVAAAGLVDGLNPCAFATLIFLVSYLAFVGRERREVLLVGLAFSLSVFVTYFLVGLGLLRAFQSVAIVPLVGRFVYLGAAGLALAFGILSLYDYALCRRGRSADMLLQMPNFLKSRVRGVIRKEVRVSRYVLAAIATGFIVSLLELACTGQVYLPTILFVSRVEEFRLTAIGYLVIYNIMFIIPLVVVFLLVYLGMGSERLSIWFQSHVSWVKLATSLVFFVLAGALSISLL